MGHSCCRPSRSPGPYAAHGALIRKYRKARDKSQATLAVEAGVHQTSIGRYENGELCPDLIKIRIAKALGVPATILFPLDLLEEENGGTAA